ncbi:PrsW family intramembrane metalloprotease [Patescibacteria group bacterium]
MIYLLYLFFGLAPSVIWLLLYLRKDAHPESKRMVIRIFLYGMLIAIPAIFFEKGFFEISSKIPLSELSLTIVNVFLGVALIEEVLKYVVVREKVLKNSALDEPTDLMVYMIIAALGFAAVENILVLLSPTKTLLIQEASLITIFRFVGATFLHALASGTIGYFLAQYFFKQKTKFLIFGFSLAVILHGIFNFIIILVYEKKLEGTIGFLAVAAILLFFALFVNFAFRKLKKLPSISQIK